MIYFHDGSSVLETFECHTTAEIIECCRGFPLSRNDRRKRWNLLEAVASFAPATQDIVRARARDVRGTKRARGRELTHGPRTRPRLGSFSGSERATSQTPSSSNAIREPLSSEDVVENEFLRAPPKDVEESCIAAFIDRTGNEALRMAVCGVCARELPHSSTTVIPVADIPSPWRLEPSNPHPKHVLTQGMLLHHTAIAADGTTHVCHECHQRLLADRTPMLALANGMWVGEIPHELAVLTLVERILIARYFPVAYIVKLFPKDPSAHLLNEECINKGLKGNVSTYRLDTNEIAGMIEGRQMPPPARLLSSVIGVTFVGPRSIPVRSLPGALRVRRGRVHNALLCLKTNNPIYRDIDISEERLEQLPMNAVPVEILAGMRYSADMDSLLREHSGYVPLEDVEPKVAQENEIPAGPGSILNIDDDEDEAYEDDDSEPTVIPLQAHGVVNAGGDDVTDTDIYSHALANTTLSNPCSFKIRRSNVFVNEYPRRDVSGARTDGGPDDPNHLLGTFPVLFPYGLGGFEVGRKEAVPYETHVRWALQYADRRFRKDLHFIFQVFGVIQKRQVCQAATLQVKRSSFNRNQSLLQAIKPSDLIRASCEESRRVPYSNPAVRALRQEVTAIRVRVQGTDESRVSIRSKIWGTNLLYNPPTIWTTINPADTQDPIAQVLAGEEIDLDNFIAEAGPDSSQRGMTIAGDPFAAAKFFHYIVNVVLEELFGIRVGRGHRIRRRAGVLGTVQAYVGTVEAQGRGTLHLHMLLWLAGAPTANVMKEALKSERFREKICEYIKANIRAHAEFSEGVDIASVPRVKGVSYSRPVDPREPDYEHLRAEREFQLVRALQLHSCSRNNCLEPRGRRYVCKRRAPFPQSTCEWIEANGAWGPKRLCGYVNNYNPAVLHSTRSNNDMKLISNGGETKDIAWYITTYTAKKQHKSSNVAALLAKRVKRHISEEKQIKDFINANKRLITRCANTLSRDHEFSAPEVISYLMGWGDRYESHYYVPIYWNNAMAALKRAYPALRTLRQSERLGRAVGLSTLSSNESGGGITLQDGTPESVVQDEEEVQTIELVEGTLTARDQLRDYAYRGDALEGYSFLDFYLDTYEGSSSKGQAKAGSSRGHPESVRVPYRPGSGKSKTSRIVRGEGHETLPQFIGSWFPRNDDPNVKELYCASMLLLLKPWRELKDLKEVGCSFHATFEEFVTEDVRALQAEAGGTASKDILKILQNIQYFHQCSDGAKQRRQEQESSGGILEIPEVDAVEEDAGPNLLDGDGDIPLTEADVDAAWLQRESVKEMLFGQAAMDIAYNAGIFSEDRPHGVFQPLPRIASAEEMPTYHAWHQQLLSITRQSACTAFNSMDVPLNANVTDGILRRDIIPGVTEDPPPPPRDHVGSRTLTSEQKRAHDIVTSQLRRYLENANAEQLLLLVVGSGGTGKSAIIESITETFERYNVSQWLAKTATSGVAASLIGGQTLHSWAGISVRRKKLDNPIGQRSSKETVRRRERNILPAKFLIIDECSMLTKDTLARASEVVQHVRATAGIGNPTLPFGGMNVILVGDFHQFPPVGDPHGALYHPSARTAREAIGRAIFQQFRAVVILREQLRVKDPEWQSILDRLRTGDCSEQDLQEMRRLVLTNPEGDMLDVDDERWRNAVLVTSRHGVRTRWNTAALHRHCNATGNRLFISSAEDVYAEGGEPVGIGDRVAVAGMTQENTGKLNGRVELAVGMRAMVVLNIATEADVANGTRGTVVDIVLDPREHVQEPDEDGVTVLQYPPAVVLFKPDVFPGVMFDGLEAGVIPICPSERPFTFQNQERKSVRVRRRQLAVTPAYAFTDYKSQGQTLEYVIVDLAPPPKGSLTPFNAYVALSRSRGRDTIRLLRDFDDKLFTHHPSEHLRDEFERLEFLAAMTINADV